MVAFEATHIILEPDISQHDTFRTTPVARPRPTVSRDRHRLIGGEKQSIKVCESPVPFKLVENLGWIFRGASTNVVLAILRKIHEVLGAAIYILHDFALL